MHRNESPNGVLLIQHLC